MVPSTAMKRQSRPLVGAVAPGGEPKLTIRVIGRCNYACPLCSTFSGLARKGGAVRPGDFRLAVDILAREDFRGVLNISGGEPTLHRHLEEMVRYASRRLPAARIVVFTNGHWVRRRGWRRRLRGLLWGRNVLVRFSIDRQHAQGAARARGGRPSARLVREMELSMFRRARLFLQACRQLKAAEGRDFDFAFKGTVQEAKDYLRPLGDVPVYPIRFQKAPHNRPREMGFFATDLTEDGKMLVYLTLGHIPAREPMGGLESLAKALSLNRAALSAKPGQTRGTGD